MKRPMPPESVLDPERVTFVPAPEVDEWMRQAFLEESSPLYNVEHDHLSQAKIAVMWTNADNTRQMRLVAGMVELPKPHPALGKWSKARFEYQLIEWFGDEELDFLMTLYAPYASIATDAQFCALVEHEMYHCAHKLKYGMPDYRRDGKPKFTIKGHDAEEFVGIVRRYGVGSAAAGVSELVEAARRKPEIADADIAGVCGTCMLRLA